MEKFKIEKYEDLIKFYFKYDTTFSETIVLDVVLKLFFFIKQFSTIVVKYENFIMEKNENVEFINTIGLTENLEEVFIWKFLNEVIVKMEIVSPLNDEVIDYNT